MQDAKVSTSTYRLAFALLSIFPPAALGNHALAQEKLVVLNSEAAEAAVVDPTTHQILARLPTGLGPREVALSPDGRLAYVANYGLGGNGRGTVTVLDLQRYRVLATYRPGTYAFLHDIRVSRNGRRLWLTAEADSGIIEMDAASGAILMFWRTGGAKSHTLVTSPDSRRLYVANAHSDSVTVIDRLTTVPKRIATGREPEGLDISPNGLELWVSNRGDHTITIIHAKRYRVLETIESGGRDPVRLRFSPDGSEVWVSNRESRSVTIFDAFTREVLGSVELDAEPQSVVFSPDGRRALVSAPQVNKVYVVDVERREVTASFRSGEGPYGMAWSILGGLDRSAVTR